MVRARPLSPSLVPLCVSALCTARTGGSAHALLPFVSARHEQADLLTSVHRKIDITTSVMQENIGLLLENDSKLEAIEGKVR
jgi:hypothetical protein